MLEMSLSKSGILEIAQYEGLCLRPYYDSVHVITFGFGSTASDIPDLNSWNKATYKTVQQAVDIFLKSIQKYINTVNQSLLSPIYQYQFDALVSICYNIGQNGESHSTFIKEINHNDSLEHIKSAILMWNKPPEIIGRRTKEANLYCIGRYTNNGTVEYLDTDGNGHQLSKTRKILNISNLFEV
jgi:lysozyme